MSRGQQGIVRPVTAADAGLHSSTEAQTVPACPSPPSREGRGRRPGVGEQTQGKAGASSSAS